MAGNLKQAASILRILNKTPDFIPIKTLAEQADIGPETLAVLIEQLNGLDKNLFERIGDLIRLSRELDLLDQAYLRQHSSRGRIQLEDEVGSTNTMMSDHADNMVDGDVIIAEIQSQGRGRRDRPWQGSIGTQVTFSLAWSFSRLQSITGLSVAVGTTIVRTLRAMGFNTVMLKWPNDLYIGDRKFGGILVETATRKNSTFAVIGVGINVFFDEYNQFMNEFGSLDQGVGEGSRENLERNLLAVSIVNAMRGDLRKFEESGFKEFREDATQYDYLKGRKVTISVYNKVFKGKVLGIDENGLLILQAGKRNLSLRSGHIVSYK